MNHQASPRTAYKIIAGAMMVATVGFCLALWWMAWIDAGKRIASARQRIDRVQWILDHHAELRRQLEAAVANPTAAAGMVIGKSPDDASTALSVRVKRIVDGSAASVISSLNLPVRTSGDFTVVAVRYQISTSIPEMTRLLHAIETSEPYLFFDSLEIVRQPPLPADPPAARRVLMQMDVHGFWHGQDNG